MPVALTLLDTRDDWLASAEAMVNAGNCKMCAFESALLTRPYAQVEQCSEGAMFLVMTHSHDLDFELCEAILSRPGGSWCGLIASHSKAVAFKRRLSAKGFSSQELLSLIAPIGLPGVAGKQPMAVAVSVVAQLLSLPVFTEAANLPVALSEERI